MTKEEIVIFKQKIQETILPVAENMSQEQIIELIELVEKQNPNLPSGFGNLLLEQINILKYNNINKAKNIDKKRLF